MPLPVEELQKLATRYKADRESVYNTWFIDNETRLKAFRLLVKACRKRTLPPFRHQHGHSKWDDKFSTPDLRR